MSDFAPVPGYEVDSNYVDENVVLINDRYINPIVGQMSTLGEDDSQYIVFELPRYPDGYDLLNTVIRIYYEMPEDLGEDLGDDIAPINVIANDEKIRIGWLIPAAMTQIAGDVKFIIHAYQEENNELSYHFKTLPSVYHIYDTLIPGAQIDEPPIEWYESFVARMESYVNVVVRGVHYLGTVGIGGTVTELPDEYVQGDMYIVISPGTYAGKTCAIGNALIARTTTGSDDDWTKVIGLSQDFVNLSESYAKGTVNGEDVEEGQPGYHDNSKYYKELTFAVYDEFAEKYEEIIETLSSHGIRLNAIESLIPSEATSANKLTDKNYVDELTDGLETALENEITRATQRESEIEDAIPDVINNVTSTSTEDALSANMGKELQAQISNMKNIGRFCAIWRADTGLPTSEPTETPYEYKVGDYFRIGVAGYRVPTGSTYVHGAYDTVEEETGIGDVWYYDGTTWIKQASSGGGTVQDVQVNGVSVLVEGIADVTVPTALSDLSEDSTHRLVTDTEKTSWNGKEDVANKVTSISASSTDTQYPSAKAVYDGKTKVTINRWESDD